MKHVVYRVLAAAIVIAAGYTVFLTVADRDFTAGFPFGILTAVFGFLLIVPTFTAYALYGEKAGNRVLVLCLKLANLPDALLDRIARRYLALPSELSQPHHEGDKPAAPSESLASAEPSHASIGQPSNKP